MKALKLFTLIVMFLASINTVSARVTETSTEKLIEHYKNTSRVMVIDCYATWCGPCQYYGPIFEEVSNLGLDADFFRLDVDKYPDCFNISSIPTTVIIYTDDSGEMQAIFKSGYMEKEELLKFVLRGISLND